MAAAPDRQFFVEAADLIERASTLGETTDVTPDATLEDLFRPFLSDCDA